MTTSEIMALLKENQNERGLENWNRLYPDPESLKSFGINLTTLRKLAKKIGRDHDLAQELWKSDYYDARIIALLIDDPKQISRTQAEIQVEQLNQGYLAHVFSSCDASLAKTPFVVELASDWIKNKDPIRRRCGYGLMYEISKTKKKSAPDDEFFLTWIKHINDSFFTENHEVKVSMGGALMGIGKRNAKLNKAALDVARNIGPIEIKSGKTKCEPFDVTKHLTSDSLKKKLGVTSLEN